MGLINLVKIKRRRHGKYETALDSKRQTTISYTVPDQDGNFVQICRKTFMDIFDVTQKRLVGLINKKKMGDTTFTDRRSNNKPSKFTDNDRQLIHQHINSFPRDVSHYSRAKSEKQFLSPDLNIHRLFKSFLEKNKGSSVSYKFYRGVFKSDFPKLSFHRPRVDTCHTCDRLNCESKQNNSDGTKAKAQLELHHRKVEKAMAYMKKENADSQLPGSDKCSISFDLQQVLFVPTLTHSDMFYLSQLSCYNLGIHLSDNNHAFMCTWHEGVSGRGGNEVASTLLKVLNSGVTEKKHLLLWSDNCTGQNKNRMVIFVLVFLVLHQVFDTIEYNFLISGHSFMCCDRDFALIEKRKRVMKAIIPNDLHEVITSAKYDPPFQVINMSVNGFWNIQEAADTYLNTKKLNISKAIRIKVDCNNPTILQMKETFSDIEAWKPVNILKNGKTLEDLKSAKLSLLPPENKISVNKKKSLTSMIPYLENPEHKAFYRELLNIQEESLGPSSSSTHL